MYPAGLCASLSPVLVIREGAPTICLSLPPIYEQLAQGVTGSEGKTVSYLAHTLDT